MKQVMISVFEIGDRVMLDPKLAKQLHLTIGPHRIVFAGEPGSDCQWIFIEGFEDAFSPSCFKLLEKNP